MWSQDELILTSILLILSNCYAFFQLCKNVSPNVDIESVCKSLVKCGYYDGVLEMCQDVATKSDSNSLSSKYISRGRPAEDVEGCKAFEARYWNNLMTEFIYFETVIVN